MTPNLTANSAAGTPLARARARRLSTLCAFAHDPCYLVEKTITRIVELPLTKSKCRFPDTERLKVSMPRKWGAAWYKNAVPSKVTCPDCGAVTSWMSSIVTAAYRRPRTQIWPGPIVSRHSMISDVNVYDEEKGPSSRQGTCARAASRQIAHHVTATPPIMPRRPWRSSARSMRDLRAV